MGATWRACDRERQLSSTANCPVEFVARSVRRFADKSGVRTDVLVEQPGPHRTRGRYGTNARFAMGKRALVRRLYLQGCACGHGGGAGVALPKTIHDPFAESDHRPARIRRELFGCGVSTACPEAISVIIYRCVIPSEVEGSLAIVCGCATGSLDFASIRDDNRYAMFDLLVGLANGQHDGGSRSFANHSKLGRIIAHNTHLYHE